MTKKNIMNMACWTALAKFEMSKPRPEIATTNTAERTRACPHILGQGRTRARARARTRSGRVWQFAENFPGQLTVYPERELRVRPRSSTDGQPIVRLKVVDVEALLSSAP
jgi:hypothetical protein